MDPMGYGFIYLSIGSNVGEAFDFRVSPIAASMSFFIPMMPVKTCGFQPGTTGSGWL